jgi:hypothetical protein
VYLALNIRERMEYMHKFLLSVNMVLELFYTSISLSLFDQKMYKKSKMAATSGLAISQNLCRKRKVLKTKIVPNDRTCSKKMFEKSKIAATSGLAISWNLCRIAKKFLNKKCPKRQDIIKKLFENPRWRSLPVWPCLGIYSE